MTSLTADESTDVVEEAMEDKDSAAISQELSHPGLVSTLSYMAISMEELTVLAYTYPWLLVSGQS